KTLFMHLSITTFSYSIDTDYLGSFEDFIAKNNKSNAAVFIDRWMHHKKDYEIYNKYARIVEEETRLPDLLRELPVDEYKVADTFPSIDRAIIIYITNSLFENLEDYKEYEKLIRLRRSKHYYEKYEQIYEALFYAVKMYEFDKRYYNNIPQVPAMEFYHDYQTKYYEMDTFYRKFYVSFDQEPNNELLKKLRENVEKLYTYRFMAEINQKWLQALTMDMSESWSLPGVLNQHT